MAETESICASARLLQLCPATVDVIDQLLLREYRRLPGFVPIVSASITAVAPIATVIAVVSISAYLRFHIILEIRDDLLLAIKERIDALAFACNGVVALKRFV